MESLGTGQYHIRKSICCSEQQTIGPVLVEGFGVRVSFKTPRLKSRQPECKLYSQSQGSSRAISQFAGVCPKTLSRSSPSSFSGTGCYYMLISCMPVLCPSEFATFLRVTMITFAACCPSLQRVQAGHEQAIMQHG